MKPLICKTLILLFLISQFSENSLNAKNHSRAPDGLVLNETEKSFLKHMLQSIKNAEQGISKLNNAILSLEGMSSSKIRHLLSNLCSMPQTSYLEIGCWKGSTFISALYRNDNSIIQALAIDNWSESGGPKAEFVRNCNTYLSNRNYQFYNADCFSIDKASIFDQPVNIYFYDGNHDVLPHELALTFYDEVLSDPFILMIDDWNWANVKIGTLQALLKLNYTFLYTQELPANFNGDTANWWNGLFIALVRKNK